MLRAVGYPAIGNWVASAAIIALPSVVLMMIYGQTRVLFTMSRDGLMPKSFSYIHVRFHTPYVVTLIAGTAVALFAAMFPVAMLADVSNSGTLFAFFMVALSVMVLRRREPDRHRPFRTPALWAVGPLAMAGCFLLFISLGWETIQLFLYWAVAGLVVYFGHARRHSLMGKITYP